MSRVHHRPLHRKLEFTLVGVALVSVLLLSLLNYAFARILVTDASESQLDALRDSRVQSFERAVTVAQNNVSILASSPSVIEAADVLSSEYRQLDDDLSAEQVERLTEAYDEALQPLRDLGEDIQTEAVLPTSTAGRWLQYHYIVENPGDYDERGLLEDAGDGSGYSAAHAEFHPLLRGLTSGAVSDLRIVDAETREIVYSTNKRPDLGTSVVDGPWSDSRLGEVIDDLANAAVGDTVISDNAFYVPSRGEAVVFMSSAIRSGSDVVGAVIAEIPVAAMTDLVTSGQDWELLGLGDTGDVYLVGEDGTLRTDPRAWLDDPEEFVENFVDRGGDLEVADEMTVRGSPALLQEVDNDAVMAALEGDEFVGSVTNYRGESTFAAAGPVEFGDFEWAVVIEQDREETLSGLNSLLRGTLIVMVILIPTTALLGWWLARGLSRPFGQLVDASARIARGQPASGIEDLGKNEIGDVGRQLENVAQTLQAEEETIIEEERRISAVLGAVVPPRLIERVRRGERKIDDIFDSATVVSLVVDGLPGGEGSDQDVAIEIAEQLGDELDALMHRFDVDRVRRSSAGGLFVAGLGHPDACVADAVGFVTAVRPIVADAGTEYGHALSLRIGVASGLAASGVIGERQMTFSVWGDPVTSAFSLSSLAAPGEILVDAAVVDALDPTWSIERREGLVGLDDDVVAFAIAPLEAATS